MVKAVKWKTTFILNILIKEFNRNIDVQADIELFGDRDTWDQKRWGGRIMIWTTSHPSGILIPQPPFGTWI